MKRLTLVLCLLTIGLAVGQTYPKLALDSAWIRLWGGLSTSTPRTGGDSWRIPPWFAITDSMAGYMAYQDSIWVGFGFVDSNRWVGVNETVQIDAAAIGAVAGADSFLLGKGMLNRGSYIVNGDSIAWDSAGYYVPAVDYGLLFMHDSARASDTTADLYANGLYLYGNMRFRGTAVDHVIWYDSAGQLTVNPYRTVVHNSAYFSDSLFYSNVIGCERLDASLTVTADTFYGILDGAVADAAHADSADVAARAWVADSSTGGATRATNATTADSSTGGATRATTAANATTADSSTGGATRASNAATADSSKGGATRATLAAAADTCNGGSYRLGGQTLADILAAASPPGEVIWWYGDSAAWPAGYVLCNGTLKFKNANGDSALTPNMVNRFPVGANGDSAGTPTTTIAGGEKSAGGDTLYTPAGDINSAQISVNGEPASVPVYDANTPLSFSGDAATIVPPYRALWPLIRSRTW